LPSVATGCGFAYFGRIGGLSICDRLPLLAAALLHNCSTICPLIGDEQARGRGARC
jgi:hypothetical protein